MDKNDTLALIARQFLMSLEAQGFMQDEEVFKVLNEIAAGFGYGIFCDWVEVNSTETKFFMKFELLSKLEKLK